MSVSDLIAALDAEVSRLQQVRAILAGMDGASRKTKAPAIKPARRKKKRTMSVEARARIAEAQRKRWAAQKKSAK